MGQGRSKLYALSIKQPWAGLVVHGIKAIEIRRWSTTRRGRILIHAARVSDDREYGWDLVPGEAKETTKLTGGIIGAVNLTGCIAYKNRKAFKGDQTLHLNHPDWFTPPQLFGFIFSAPERVSFRPFSGNVRFFTVSDEDDN